VADEVVIKLDLHGSTQQQGFTDFRLTRATRRGILTGLNNDRNILRQAITRAVGEAGAVHHNIPSLPLAAASAVRFGASKALVRLSYQFSRYRTTAAQTAGRTLVRTRSRYISALVYAGWLDENGNFAVSPGGLPNGKIIGIPTDKLSDADQIPLRYILRVPMTQLTVETVLPEDPLGQVGPLLDKVNAEAVVIGTITYGPGQLQFIDVAIDWSFEENPAAPGAFIISYYTRYTFVATKGLHVQQQIAAPGSRLFGQDITVWTLYEELKAETASFIGAFPFNLGFG